MAAQKSLRAFINSAPRRGIQLAKVKLREEGEKKVQELKAKIPTPQELVEKLLSESCNPQIIIKLNATHAMLMGIVLPIENTLNSVDDFLQKIKNPPPENQHFDQKSKFHHPKTNFLTKNQNSISQKPKC